MLYDNPSELLYVFENEQGEIQRIQRLTGLLPDKDHLQKLILFLQKSLDNYQRTEAYNQRVLDIRNTPAPQDLTGFIYIATDVAVPGLLKIGYSRTPKLRERTLQAEKPTINIVSTFPGSLSQEAKIHEVLSVDRVRGEWFRVTPEHATTIVKRVLAPF